MNSRDYLWSREGSDPELERIERQLACFRYRPGKTAPVLSTGRSRRTRRLLWAAAVAASLVAVAWLGLQAYIHWPQGKAWPVTFIAATGERTSFLEVGATLTTGPGERVTAEVARIGLISLAPRSSVTLVQTQTAQHVIQLNTGELEIRAWAPPHQVTVAVGNLEIVDLGCRFSVRRDEGTGVIRLHVSSGWVIIPGPSEMPVPEGTEVAIQSDGQIGLPFAVDASDRFRTLANELDQALANGQPIPDSLPLLAGLVRADDAITAILLVQRHPTLAETQLYDAINRATKISNPPSRRALRAGDVHAVNVWWDALPYPRSKRWWLHWSDAPAFR